MLWSEVHWCPMPVLEMMFIPWWSPDASVSKLGLLLWRLLNSSSPSAFIESRVEAFCTIPNRYSWNSHPGAGRSPWGAGASLRHWNENVCCCNTSYTAVVSVLALLPSSLTNAVGTWQAKLCGLLCPWLFETKKLKRGTQHSGLQNKVVLCCWRIFKNESWSGSC